MRRESGLTFLEFFAGAGMARIGLGPGWTCLFANDVDPLKADIYAKAQGARHLHLGDVGALEGRMVPRGALLAWASSPCQDVSLAGGREGLSGVRSGAFFGFWRQMEALGADAPKLIVIENVLGLATSHAGADLGEIFRLLSEAGYWAGALAIDAGWYLPQSRPRLFVIASRSPPPPALLARAAPVSAADRAIGNAMAWAEAAAPDARRRLVRWRFERPVAPPPPLAEMIEPDSACDCWHSAAKTAKLLGLMNTAHRDMVADASVAAKTDGRTRIGAVYRRVRLEVGGRVQRAEVRFDGNVGCLRTAKGGSSRQFLVFCEADGAIRSRALTPREGARLMGLADDFPLPKSQTAAFHVLGDGVAVPVVRALAAQILEPLADSESAERAA